MIPIPSLSQIKAAAVFVLVLLACLTTHKCTADHYKLKMERKDRAAAEALVRTEQKARKQEQDWSAAFDVAGTMYQERVNDTQKDRDRIMRDYRAVLGRLSFRPGCPSVPQVAADTAATEGRAEGGQLGMVGEAITERLAVCDEVTLERNLAVRLLEAERQAEIYPKSQ